jgi:hypothetical protein
VQPLPRVHAVEGLVEDESRVVDERGGHLDALAHALRVAADGPSGGRLQVDHLDRAPRGRRVVEALEPCRASTNCGR